MSDQPAGIGHNRMDEDRKRLLFQFASHIAPLRKTVKECNAKMSEIKKLAKEQGITDRMIRRFFEMREKKESDIAEQMKEDREIATWLALPFISQADLFKEDATAVEDIPFAEGEAAGLLDEPAKAPEKYAPDSAEGQAWITGWHSGQEKAKLPLFRNAEAEEEEEEHEEFEGAEAGEPQLTEAEEQLE